MKNQEKQQKRKKQINYKRVLFALILVIVYFVSVFLVVYPYVDCEIQSIKSQNIAEEVKKDIDKASGSYTSTMEVPITGYKRVLKQTGVVVTERELVQQFGASGDLQYADLLDAMLEYNERIYREHQDGLTDAWSYRATAINLKDYGIEDDIVGVVEIPSMGVSFPIYLGATDSHMSKGLAQLTQTSMPIGGINTNCVLAGHRGWINGGKYLKDIEKVQVGDTIKVDTLWYPMEYVVSEIRIIYPNDVDEILIVPGKDLITLVTCHPYGTGGRYYRYLVIAERVNNSHLTYSETYEWVEEPCTDVVVEKQETINLPEVQYFSSEKEIVIDDTIHIIGCVLAVFIPIMYIVFTVVRRVRRRKSSAKED